MYNLHTVSNIKIYSSSAGMSIQEIASRAQPDLLVDLLETCFDKFCNVVAAHEVLLQRLQTTKQVWDRRPSNRTIDYFL